MLDWFDEEKNPPTKAVPPVTAVPVILISRLESAVTLVQEPPVTVPPLVNRH